MISEIYWINETVLGKKQLGTMARPRGNDWLQDEIKWLKIRAVDCLVSLLEPTETWELGLNEEAAICKKWKIQFINFPIQDVKTPKNKAQFIILTESLANQIKAGKKVVIHCRMGIGRASMLAAAIMIKLGCEGKSVFNKIEKYRKLTVPDTPQQKEWIFALEKDLN